MNKKISKSYCTYKKYYDKKREQGWKSISVMGPETMLDELKVWIKNYKSKNNLYIQRNATPDSNSSLTNDNSNTDIQ